MRLVEQAQTPARGRRRWPTARRSGSPSSPSARARSTLVAWLAAGASRPTPSSAWSRCWSSPAPRARPGRPAGDRDLHHPRRAQRPAGARPPRAGGGAEPQRRGLRQDRHAHAAASTAWSTMRRPRVLDDRRGAPARGRGGARLRAPGRAGDRHERRGARRSASRPPRSSRPIPGHGVQRRRWRGGDCTVGGPNLLRQLGGRRCRGARGRSPSDAAARGQGVDLPARGRPRCSPPSPSRTRCARSRARRCGGCTSSGIEVVMLTGDARPVADAVARGARHRHRVRRGAAGAEGGEDPGAAAAGQARGHGGRRRERRAGAGDRGRRHRDRRRHRRGGRGRRRRAGPERPARRAAHHRALAARATGRWCRTSGGRPATTSSPFRWPPACSRRGASCCSPAVGAVLMSASTVIVAINAQLLRTELSP